MSWKRRFLEAIVWSSAQVAPKLSTVPEQPESILVLRNNDLGDVLIISPLFAALRQRFPKAHIAAAVGAWSADILKLNPHIDEIIPVTAPWYNKFIADQSLAAVFRYLLFSPELKQVKQKNFTIGIDIFGSQFGAFFMLRAGIPYRLGVKGFAWGHSAAQQCVNYNQWEQVGRSALRFAELLGASEIPEARPQIFLSESETAAAQKLWARLEANLDINLDPSSDPNLAANSDPDSALNIDVNSESAQALKPDRRSDLADIADPPNSDRSTTGDLHTRSRCRRLVISPGAGFVEKAWSLANYIELIKILTTSDQSSTLQIVVVGGKGDRTAGEQIAAVADNVHNLAGDLALRATFALVSLSDLVICNSSMLMHVAAAFEIPNVVLLGEFFTSTNQHAAQWGYARTCWVYGKEEGDRPDVYTPQEVAAIVAKLLN
jgi:ADP-heptose:LPS heptosyltransferase